MVNIYSRRNFKNWCSLIVNDQLAAIIEADLYYSNIIEADLYPPLLC